MSEARFVISHIGVCELGITNNDNGKTMMFCEENEVFLRAATTPIGLNYSLVDPVFNKNQIIHIINEGAGNLILTVENSKTIAGSASTTVSASSVLNLRSDGTNYIAYDEGLSLHPSTEDKQDSMITELQNIDTGKLEESTFTSHIGEVQATPTTNTVLSRLKAIADNQSGDEATETKQDNIITELQNIDAGKLEENTFLTRIGEVQETPTLYTALRRLKDIDDKLGVIDNMISGNESQVDIVGPLPAGTNNIGTIVTIKKAHQKIHDGEHYTCQDYDNDVNTSAVKYWHIITPNTATRINMCVEARFKESGLFELYENPTTTDNGTGLTIFNSDRNSANTPTALIYKDPTVSSDGTRLLVNKIGSGKNVGGTLQRDHEYILKQNEQYLIKCTTDSNDNQISMCFEFYEV